VSILVSFKQFLYESNIIQAYHGSGRSFDKFDQKHARLPNDYYGGGVGYFTDHYDTAKSYARNMSKETKTPHVYHVSIHSNNLFDIDHKFTGEHLRSLLPKNKEEFARHAGLLRYGEDKYQTLAKLDNGNMHLTGDQIFRGLSHGMSKTSKAREHLISKGYDGLRYNGGLQTMTGIHHNVYIPYNADSIKIHKKEKL